MEKATVVTMWLAGLTVAVGASIAGVTYMDHFDFEERYRDVHECDPFYWHPLHLPDECMELYDKVIRSGITAANQGPVRIVVPRDFRLEYKNPNFNSRDYDSYEDSDSSDDHTSRQHGRRKHMRKATPYESLLESLREDIQIKPSEAEVRMSNIGPVTFYQQPISRVSQKMIQEITGVKYEKKKSRRSNGKFKKSLRKLLNMKNSMKIRKNGYDLIVFDDSNGISTTTGAS